ncbi:HAMP domain-containing sensor histidine kinase [Mycolicibacterium aubagnense]|uniref:histidine kinase n=1 Tax=Mycolicibacterium aubagnense TaxID=319707 RepID=A0ABN5YYV8_9MYCO|nr:ATP-binding protein [Mycolicibacterium aubagnense]TLH66750.1 two-component sensor histidine kinase [Mycolicibacterium aubagnense]WGI31657.1 ATP-binding protein [Mycolicibacterium aubagnense]BBX86863.1 putative sensor histidine kinase [Mycolicibacterium aubagnense]
MAQNHPRSKHGIRSRLLVTNAVVVVAAIVTTTTVALIIGPPMFRKVMQDVLIPGRTGPHPYEHVFRQATAVSVGMSLAVAATTALALSWYLSRRMHRSTAELAAAATAVADGNYDIRVSPPHLGTEFDAIADAFNTMAEQLGSVEMTRRQLLADLAHELRTPVSVIDAYLESIEDGIHPLDSTTIGVLRDQTRRLARLSSDVRALSDAERDMALIDTRSVAPTAVIAAAVDAFAAPYRAKGVALTSDIAPGLPDLWADPQRLDQVLANLLTNALRHTEPGGTVRVMATNAGASVQIQVSDDGDGIAAEHLPRLFERFYRADSARDRAHGGSGIGLAIAKALVDAHHGRISAASAGVGSGATFTVELPCRATSLAASREP